jgi:magnesium chelatase family protein
MGLDLGSMHRMLTRVFSAAIQGVEAIQVEIEVNAGSGDPVIVLVGLPDAAVRESKDRVTTAIANSGFRWPRSRTEFRSRLTQRAGPRA